MGLARARVRHLSLAAGFPMSSYSGYMMANQAGANWKEPAAPAAATTATAAPSAAAHPPSAPPAPVPAAGATTYPFSIFRFGLRDVLLATALLGLCLAMALHVHRRMALKSDWFRAKSIAEIVLPAMAMTVVAGSSWCVARGCRPRLSIGLLAAGIAGSAWALWPRARWLYVVEQHLCCVLAGDVIEHADLLCSGFRPRDRD